VSDEAGKAAVTLVGLVRPRNHCTFDWRQPAAGGPRTVQVGATHCPECVAELSKQGYRFVEGSGGTTRD
jgi:hypothetical protein